MAEETTSEDKAETQKSLTKSEATTWITNIAQKLSALSDDQASELDKKITPTLSLAQIKEIFTEQRKIAVANKTALFETVTLTGKEFLDWADPLKTA